MLTQKSYYYVLNKLEMTMKNYDQSAVEINHNPIYKSNKSLARYF